MTLKLPTTCGYEYSLMRNIFVSWSNLKEIPTQITREIVSINDLNLVVAMLVSSSSTNMASVVCNTAFGRWQIMPSQTLIQPYGFSGTLMLSKTKCSLSSTKHYVLYFIVRDLYKCLLGQTYKVTLLWCLWMPMS